MNKKYTVLIVDDEQPILDSLREILAEDGASVIEATTAAQAREKALMDIDLAIVDIMLGMDNGIQVLEYIKKQLPHVPVIMISGQATVTLTAAAFKMGARDFMEKPLRLVSVRACVRNALEALDLKHRIAQAEGLSHPKAVFQSSIMRDLYDQVKLLAGRVEPVVIMGPSGSGKELVARALHEQGPRRDGPFIATNAASLPVNLAEDELFGHEKGAFTGAHERRIGSLEMADNGTLFLDEIADMDPVVQAKLLRVIETRQFLRLGGSKTVNVDARIVAATHKDLQRLAQENVFRHDLWYRLCTFVLNVPALHERCEDIPLLAREFLERMSDEMSVRYVFSPAAVIALSRRTYPGNIRELKHIVTRAAVFSEKNVIDETTIERVAPCEGDIASPGRMPSTPVTAYMNLDFRSARDAFERDYLSAMLARHNGNITAAAADIGMAQSNLSRKLKDLGLK